jgi:hypothetical protein
MPTIQENIRRYLAGDFKNMKNIIKRRRRVIAAGGYRTCA